MRISLSTAVTGRSECFLLFLTFLVLVGDVRGVRALRTCARILLSRDGDLRNGISGSVCVYMEGRPHARCPAGAANVATLPDNMLSVGQPRMKLQEDLNAAQNSVNLLAEMLAPITLDSAADVKQVPPSMCCPAGHHNRCRVAPPAWAPVARRVW